MKNDQSQTVMSIMNSLDGVSLHEKQGHSFKFKMYMTKRMSETPLEALELSVRSRNCLRRAGYHTIGEVAFAVASGMDLKRIRNCGKTSAREIMEHLFLFQYESLPANKKEAYLRDVVQLNNSTGAN